jgi:hypothetical protein
VAHGLFWLVQGDNDDDYYETSNAMNSAFFPPRDGWYTDPDGKGLDPPPTLVLSPEFQLEGILSCSRADRGVLHNKAKKCLSKTLKKGFLDSLIQEAAVYWSCIRTMELRIDREKISAALFQFIVADPGHVGAARSAVIQLLDVASRKERCVALELAVWKFLCTMQCPGNLKGILDMTEWCRRGWKIRKQETRHSNAFPIIISSVLPFLDSLVLPAGP